MLYFKCCKNVTKVYRILYIFKLLKFFFETHRDIGHIVFCNVLIHNVLYKTYVFSVPMCFKKNDPTLQ
jgi:hypothetical protein